MDQTTNSEGFVLWLTGLSGSGKSTVAERLYDELTALGKRVERLDGDVLREVFPNTGFTKEARDEHVKRVGFLASRLEHHGVIVIAAFISPYRDARGFVRNLCSHFHEVFVDASLDECKRRDVKGLYKKVEAGQIKNFTGVDDPYEAPEKPEITIDTQNQTVEESVNHILSQIKPLL